MPNNCRAGVLPSGRVKTPRPPGPQPHSQLFWQPLPLRNLFFYLNNGEVQQKGVIFHKVGEIKWRCV